MTSSSAAPPSKDFQAMALQTYDCFFYGTLMVPAILNRVLGQQNTRLTFQDAVLLDHTRHCVKAADYPGVISKADAETLAGRSLTQEEASVRGTLVKGLSSRDIKALDVFEGSEYTRQIVAIHAISEARSFKDLADGSEPNKPAAPIAQLVENSQRVPATAYLYTAGLNRLEPAVWSLKDFMRDKADRWTGPSDEFTEVDDHNAQAGDLPEFGKNLLQYWGFDKDYVAINNGSYGAPPKPVSHSVTSMMDKIERNPDSFHKRDYLPLLKEVRQKLAGVIGASVDEVVMVPNTTSAINLIINNTVWKKGDIIITYETTYGGVSQGVKYACDMRPDVSMHVVKIKFPTTHTAMIEETEAAIASFNELSSDGAVGKGEQRVRMVIVDAIASNPGIIYPWQKIVDICKRYGVLSVIDAAHQIGQQQVDVTASGCDFWVSNVHKWMMCHRSVAAFYVPRRNQHLIRSTFPTGFAYESSRYPTQGMDRPWSFANQFDWAGCVDLKPVLSVVPALEFREFLGGEERINSYCHDLAVKGGQKMAEILGTETMDNEAGELTAHMVNVALPSMPPADSLPEKLKLGAFFTDRLFKRNTFVPVFWFSGKWWFRASAQVWNDITDFEYLAHALQDIIKEANEVRL